MVKEGYKETEIGVIPEDWNVKKINDIAIPKARIGWQNLRKEEYLTNGNYLLITGTDFSDGKIVLDKCYYVSKERYIQDKNIQVSNGAVLITKDGTLGKVALVAGLDKPATLNAGVFVLNNLNDNVDNRFLYQYLRTNALLKYATETSTGGTIKHLNQNVLINFCVPYPSKEEQQKIAEALLDMDSLISSLEKLIEKKKAIKRGAIHELLTAKKSLSGFKSEKVSVKLSDIAIIKDGTHGTYNRVDNGVYLLSAKNIFNNHMEVTDNESMISFEDYSSIVSNGFPKENDILLSCVGTIGRCCIYTGTPRAAFQRSVAFVRSKNVDVRYLLCLLQSEAIQKQLKESSNASAQGGVYLGALENLNIEIFADINEQKAIANILFDMDIEITALEQKLTKCKKLKQGMMQQLLTGKIRLI